MKACSVQLCFYDMPLLEKPEDSKPEAKYEWYERISLNSNWQDVEWIHEHVEIDSSSTLAFHEAISRIQSIARKMSASGNEAIILDFSSYINFCHKDWDATTTGWNCLDSFSEIYLIFHNKATLEGSDSLIEQYKQVNNSGRKFIVIDDVGIKYDLTLSGNDRRMYLPDYRRFVKLISQKDFLRLVREQSRRHFGHYINESGAHIRTRYDIKPLIQNRSAAYEYIVSKFRDIFLSDPADMIICCGIGMSFLEELKVNLINDFCVPVELYSIYEEISVFSKIRTGMSVAVFTDVLLTGQTVLSLCEKLKSKQISIKNIYSVITLNNSVPHINCGDIIPVMSCLKIRRDYYLKPEDCPLCLYSDIKPKHIKTERDVLDSIDRNSTWYDFWELLLESEAFEISHSISKNHRNHYLAKVNTYKVFKEYGSFIAEILVKKMEKKIGKDVFDFIICPSEPAAALLSYHLAKQLCIENSKVFGIVREDLDKCVPNSSNDEIVKKYVKKISAVCGSFRRVLIVDDGVNSTRTLSHLASLVGAMLYNVKGGAFFISRIESIDTESLIKIYCQNAFFFYRVGMTPFTKCPVCIG